MQVDYGDSCPRSIAPAIRADTDDAIACHRSTGKSRSPPYPSLVQVECRFFGPFREDVGERSVEIETAAETYGDLLAELEDRYPELSGRLIEDGSLVGEVAVTRNTKNIRHLEGPETPLRDGDVIRLTPSVYGGCVMTGSKR